MNIRNKEGLSFDDVLLVPKYSNIGTRKDVNPYARPVNDVIIDSPILSANMDTVTEWQMARKLGELGGLGVLHRFMSPEELEKQCFLCKGVPFGISVGVKSSTDPAMIYYLQSKYDITLVVIDVAHGDHSNVMSMIKRLKNAGVKRIMAGNIATTEAAMRLVDAGVDALKVGIGPGSQCTTRLETGHGMPQLTAIDNVAAVADSYNVRVCADGGIRNAGDIVKALAAGADTVMIGNLFAATDEAPGEIVKEAIVDPRINSVTEHKVYKLYRGNASRGAKENSGQELRNIEGKTSQVLVKGPVEYVFNHLMDGVRSGLSYSGAYNIDGLQARAEFIRVTPNDHHLKR